MRKLLVSPPPVDLLESNSTSAVAGRTRLTPWVLGASATVTGLMPIAAQAGFMFTPPAGVTEYRLAFVTSTAVAATSSVIGSYNSFVTTAAGLDPSLPSTTWTVIGSTASVNALTNDSCGTTCDSTVPIYLVDGTTKVADSLNGLFGGSITNTISETENGASVGASTYRWTGSNADGTGDAGHELGSFRPQTGVTDFGALAMISVGSLGPTGLFPLYAISGDIVVTTAAPEPMSLSLLAFGGIATVLARGRRRAAARPPAI